MSKQLFVIQNADNPTLYLGRYDMNSQLTWVEFTWAYTFGTETEAAACMGYAPHGVGRIVDVNAVNHA